MGHITESHWTHAHSTLLLAVALTPREIGQRIKAARKAKHWTQLEFALEAKVSPSTVARWERGQLPPVAELIRIAGVLEVEPEELVEPGESDAQAADSVRSHLARLEEEVAANSGRLTRIETLL